MHTDDIATVLDPDADRHARASLVPLSTLQQSQFDGFEYNLNRTPNRRWSGGSSRDVSSSRDQVADELPLLDRHASLKNNRGDSSFGTAATTFVGAADSEDSAQTAPLLAGCASSQLLDSSQLSQEDSTMQPREPLLLREAAEKAAESRRLSEGDVSEEEEEGS